MTATSSRKRTAESMVAGSESDADISPPQKKTTKSKLANKSTDSASEIRTYSAAELTTFSHDDLIAYAVSLQKQLDAKPTTPATKELTPQELSQKKQLIRTLMERQIRKSMTWKPSCKTGSATFSQDFLVQSEQVLRELFKRVVKDGSKAWKMKKFTIDEFETVVGQGIKASVRYASLYLTNDVTVRWDAGNGTMKCSGKYGLFGTGRAALASSNDQDNEDDGL